MDSERTSTLASIGFAVRATAPVLLHAIRGSLHDVTMLAALLQPPGVAHDDGAAAKTAQRLSSINAELERLERNVALLGGMIEWPGRRGEAVCSTASALPDVLRLLRDEAARHRIRLEQDLDGLPPYLHADERALQQVLLTCGAWAAQHLGERATMRISGREEDGEAVFEFEVSSPSTPIAEPSAPRDESALLIALAEAAGGNLSTTPRLRLAFRRASDRRAAAA